MSPADLLHILITGTGFGVKVVSATEVKLKV
jgi:hypothetical protein